MHSSATSVYAQHVAVPKPLVAIVLSLRPHVCIEISQMKLQRPKVLAGATFLDANYHMGQASVKRTVQQALCYLRDKVRTEGFGYLVHLWIVRVPGLPSWQSTARLLVVLVLGYMSAMLQTRLCARHCSSPSTTRFNVRKAAQVGCMQLPMCATPLTAPPRGVHLVLPRP